MMSKKSVAVDQERQEAALRQLITLTATGKCSLYMNSTSIGDQISALLSKGIVARLTALLDCDDEVICRLVCIAINNMCSHGESLHSFLLCCGQLHSK